MTLALLIGVKWSCCLCPEGGAAEDAGEADQDVCRHLREFHARDLRLVCRSEQPARRDGKLRVRYTGPKPLNPDGRW